MKTHLCVSAVCKLAWLQRPQGFTETHPQVSKNVIKFETTSSSPALDSSRPQMFTVSKYFLCEAPAWKHLNLIALHVCFYQKSYAQTHRLPSASLRKQLAAVMSHSCEGCWPAGPSTAHSWPLLQETLLPLPAMPFPDLCIPLLSLIHHHHLFSEVFLDFLSQPEFQVFPCICSISRLMHAVASQFMCLISPYSIP